MRRVVRPEPDLLTGDSSASALAVVRGQGLDLYPKPDSEIPRISDVEDLTDLSDQSLMGLFQRLTAWADYLAGQVACAIVDEREAQKAVDRAEAAAMVSGWEGKATERVRLAKARADSDESVLDARDTLDTRYAYRKLVEVLAAGVERDASLVSREITRRTSFAATPRKAWTA